MSNENLHGLKKKLYYVYEKHYKKLMLIPLTLLILSIFQIGFQVATTGDFIRKGISLKGGITLTIPTEEDIDMTELQDALSAEFQGYEISARNLLSSGLKTGIIIESDIDVDDAKLMRSFIASIKENTGLSMKEGTYNVESMGSTLGNSFFRQTLVALLIAFIFMSLVVFIIFRSLVPSFAVILSAVTDILFSLAMFNLFGMKLSTAGVAAFLMLIGYSVDTDILLATKVLKRKGGTVLDRVLSAVKTGLTTNFTTMAAVLVALFLTQSDAIRQIMTIIMFGLIMDLPSTWLQNAGILRFYMEKKERSRMGVEQ